MRMRCQPDKVRRLFDAKAWRELPFTLWACYLFVSLCGLYLPSFYIQLYGVKFMDASLSFYLLPALNAGSFFGRLVSTLVGHPLYTGDNDVIDRFTVPVVYC